MNWSPVANATGYRVYGNLTGGDVRANLQETGAVQLTWKGLTNYKSYTFVVAAFNETGEGELSGTYMGTPFEPSLPPPTFTTVTGGDGRVFLQWTGVAGAATYRVCSAHVNAFTCSTPRFTPGTSLVWGNLVNGQAVTFTVEGVRTDGQIGTQSGSFTVTPNK